MFLLHKQFSERGKNRTNNSSFKAWSSCNKIRWDQMEIMATTKKTKCQTQKKSWYYIISKNIMQTRLFPRVFFSSYYCSKGTFIQKEEQRSFTSVLLVFVLLRMWRRSLFLLCFCFRWLLVLIQEHFSLCFCFHLLPPEQNHKLTKPSAKSLFQMLLRETLRVGWMAHPKHE